MSTVSIVEQALADFMRRHGQLGEDSPLRAVDHAKRQLQDAARKAVAAGHTWETIGYMLEMTGDEARDRFGL